MADFEVKVRNLKTGEMMVASMPDAATCIDWLKERPPFVEIVSVLSDCSPADSQRMKEAMRPYDSVERELKARYDQKASEAARAAYQKELEAIQEDQSAAVDEMAKLDPDRPIAVRYELDDGLVVVDDDRELTDAAREACLAWVKERNGWIASKGQVIGEAHLEVWPNVVPENEERVREGGRFFPRLKDS